MQNSSFKGYLALIMALALLLVAIFPTSALAARTSASRGKLFVFVRGIDSFLTPVQAAAQGGDGSDPYFFRIGNLGAYLQSQGYSNARYLEYSYASLGSTDTGQPRPYKCQDTYNYPLASHITELSRQISSAVQNRANTDVYLIGHSMGGIISFGYLASLLEHVGTVVPLPRNGSRLKGIVTLDSPLGGVTSDSSYRKLVFLRSFSCEGLEVWDAIAVNQIQALFRTASSSMARGATASIVQAILNGGYLSNQRVATDAKQTGISVLTLGNTNDLLWRPSVCNKLFKVNMQDFSSTQWLQDEGAKSQVYSRMFTSGFQNCALGLLNLANHSDAFGVFAVKKALVQFVNGSTPG